MSLATLTVLVTAGCSMAKPRPPVDASASPRTELGYLGGVFDVFDTATDARYGLRVVNTRTGEEHVLSMGETAALKYATVIELPPATYRVSQWVNYSRVLKQQTLAEDLPGTHPLARPFELRPGEVVLLGGIRARGERTHSGTRYRKQVALDPTITQSDARARLVAAYPGFAGAPTRCLLCPPDAPPKATPVVPKVAPGAR